MLKHQPCCRAVLAEKQNKKIIHKNPVSVLLPLKSQGWGLRGLLSPPALRDGWATHGGPMAVMVQRRGCQLPSQCCCPVPSHPVTGRAGGPRHPPALRGCWHPHGARVQRRREAAASCLKQPQRSGSGQEMPCKE